MGMRIAYESGHKEAAMPTFEQDPKERLYALIKDIKVAMLTTVGEDGALISRPMMTQETEFDGTFWFFTSDESPKAKELHRSSKVNLTFSATQNYRFVSVSGDAEVVHDRDKAQELWKPAYKAWFPGGLDDPHLALLKVTVHSAQYWDSPSNPVVQLIGYAKAMLTGDTSGLGENRKLALG